MHYDEICAECGAERIRWQYTHLGPFSNPAAAPYEMPLSLIIFGCTNELRSSPSRAISLWGVGDEMGMNECSWYVIIGHLSDIVVRYHSPCRLDVLLRTMLLMIVFLYVLHRISSSSSHAILLLMFQAKSLLHLIGVKCVIFVRTKHE